MKLTLPEPSDEASTLAAGLGLAATAMAGNRRPRGT